MKIYKIHMNMESVLGRLKQVRLHQYSDTKAIIFVAGSDPDDATHKAYTGLSALIMKSKPKGEKTLAFISDILNDVRVTRIEIDEK